MKHTTLKIIVFALLLFALLTLFLSGSVIFNLFGIREKEGNYVSFVVWANFISSILYIVAAYGLFNIKKWPVKILILTVLILVSALIGLKLHANSGGLYETKTIYAMIFRISITILLTVGAYYLIKKIKTVDQKIT